MVLDANVNPMPDSEYTGYTYGSGYDTRINYAFYSCSARNAEQPGACPVDDLPKCISNLKALVGGDAEWPEILRKFLSIFDKDGAGEEICTLAADGDAAGVMNFFNEDDTETNSSALLKQMNEDPPSQPTDSDYVYGKPNYSTLTENGSFSVPLDLVFAQDYFSGLYNADYFAKSK